MSKSYVLLSGGVDSTTCLAMAHKRYNGSVTGFIFNYGQRHQKEIEHARRICNHYNVPSIIKNIEGIIGVGGLTDKTLVVPDASYADLPEGVSPTYVPFRNGLLLSVAVSNIVADPEAEAIYYGAHAEDAERDAYPDCSVPFIGAMADAIYIGTYKQIRLMTPLQDMTKREVVLAGERLSAPWDLTWSCYEGGKYPCGKCPTCRSRQDAFIGAGVIDPVRYAA